MSNLKTNIYVYYTYHDIYSKVRCFGKSRNVARVSKIIYMYQQNSYYWELEFFFFDIYLQLRVVYTSDKQIKNNISTLLLFLFESVKRTPIFRFDESSAKEFSRNLQ